MRSLRNRGSIAAVRRAWPAPMAPPRDRRRDDKVKARSYVLPRSDAPAPLALNEENGHEFAGT
jgi:hypothetical protein